MPSTLRKQKDRERKERTREGLIQAAIRTFSHRGYHHTLISDVVAEAGVGQGTFYRYFRSKREVFEFIFDRFEEEVYSQFQEMSDNIPTNLEEYKAASLKGVVALTRFLDRNRKVVSMFLREATAIDRDFEEKMLRLQERFADLAKFFLDYAITQGFARPCRTDVISRSLVGIALHLARSRWLEERPGLTLEELAEEIVTFAFQGFGPEG